MIKVLTSIANIKIPYPVEGVVRTAQLDDTISPDDSVQLAVNMNFDRVGALQTRLGVTEYAPTLGEEVTNFGTLKNAIIPPGYTRLFQVGDENELTTDFDVPASVKISDEKVAIFWQGADGDGFCQNFSLDILTGAMAPIGIALEFDTANADNIKAIKVTDDIVLVVWTGSGNDGFAQCFDVSGDSITAMSSPLEFDTTNGDNIAIAQIDATHFICFYEGAASVGNATVFAVNTTSGAVTQPGATLTFDAGTTFNQSCCALGDGTHFICAWMSGATPKVQTFEVNTGTWAITALSTALTFATTFSQGNVLSVGDSQHFVNIFQGTVSAVSGKWAQAYEVNLSTFAITAVGTGIRFYTNTGNDTFALSYGDGEHFISFYSQNVGIGFVQMLEMNPSTYDMTAVGPELSGYDFANGGRTNGFVIDETKVVAVWGNVDALEGKSVMFQSFGDLVTGQWLYASHGDEVSNLASGAWTSRRSGLAEVSKPRFSQYLNYIWMVNGNDAIGGDPVATSDGGDFGTDLVPDEFPAGDFISAGFEGRVWVADKTLGILYYTDIVQFIPPATYVLTYNPDVNFITTIAPQTGESFTALYQVPRALLVFTQNNIYRIYGASSLDAYPAYNVGTYSQESIVQTKTGIFFHHSSGFYQFDYGSQPIEISRRIIDFVQAIPRSSYEDITGVYDGFDAVEWSIGQVTVEGVVFANCVVRYTISTQVWTIYDYPNNVITAMIAYDDSTDLNHLMGTSVGLVGAIDTGYTDFGQPFYFEYIDRWRSITDMYYQVKAISGFNIYTENAAGANFMYQEQKSGPNAWKPIGTVNEVGNSLLPNSGTDEFNVLRLRLAGTTSGAQVVVHGVEITELEIRGQEQN